MLKATVHSGPQALNPNLIETTPMNKTLLVLAFAFAAPTLQAAEFKLYSAPQAKPSDFCDVYTSLSLTEGVAHPQALLVNRLAGLCEIAILPNERLFDLTVTTDGCGAKIFKGTRLTSGDGPTAITIVDNRTMTCETPLLAMIYVEETYQQGLKERLYSHDAAPKSTAALTLVCGMQDQNAAPYLTFIMKRQAGAQKAGISYVRSAFLGSEELQFEQPVPGCEAANVGTTAISADEAYVECDGDGDAGYLSLTRQPATGVFEGAMAFPNSGVEGYDDQSIAVSCRVQ